MPEKTDLDDAWMAEHYAAAYRCTHCQCVTAVRWIAGTPTDDEYSGDWGYVPDPDNALWGEVTRYPEPMTTRSFPDVPGKIASAAQEAWQSYDAGLHRGALGTARAVIESVAKAHGITGRSLETKINNMIEQDLLPKRLSVAVHEIRYAGNDVAHGDLGRTVNSFETEILLTVMSQVLDEVYSAPAQIERLKKAREEREQKAKGARGAEPPF